MNATHTTHPMNADIFSGYLRQLLGQLRVQLGKIIGSEHQIAQGQNDLHIGQLQQAYGTARYKAQQQARQLKAHTDSAGPRD